MAVLIFNIRREPTLAAKEENDIKIHRGDLEQIKADGRCKTISDDDYHSYVCREKEATLDGDNVVFTTIPEDAKLPDNHSESDFDNWMQKYQDLVSQTLREKQTELSQAEFSGLKTRLEGLKSGCASVDKSGITFPLTTSVARYWIDNESSEMFDLQFIS
jgi:hypothetical protein|tara:strand:- start:955 stop:1434 length:480 start_codon:yes stop_codon:yes gene_type:complete